VIADSAINKLSYANKFMAVHRSTSGFIICTATAVGDGFYAQHRHRISIWES